MQSGCLRLRAWSMLMNAEAHVSRRHVDEPQLHLLDAVPAVETQGTGGVHGSPAALPEGDPEFLPSGAKRDGIDDRAVAGAQPHTHMRLPHPFDIDEAVGGKRNARLGIT